MAGLTALDLGILVFVAIGVWRGLRTGALSQLVGTVGLVIGLVAGVLLMDPVGAVVVNSLGLSTRLAPVLGFVVTLAVVIGAAAVAAQLVRKALDLLRLGVLDRVAGAGLGALRTALWLSVLLLITGPVALPGGDPLLIGQETREQSVLYEPVRALAPAAWAAFSSVVPGLSDPLSAAFGDGLTNAD
jgi:membrane protein required for colicin V production